MRRYSKNPSFQYGRSRSILVLLLLMGSLSTNLQSCSHKNWIKVKDNGCSVFDPEPVKGQILAWDGACVDGYAQGYGVISVYENGDLSFTCEGNADQGRLQGMIVFSVYKNKERWCQYEEQWKNGKPQKRTRNITLDDVLSVAGEAREYLYLLKKYQKEHPDVWIDDFHDILLKKTSFACRDIEESLPGFSHKPAHSIGTEDAGTADKGTGEKGKIFKGELFLKAYDHHLSAHVFYTVFHHRSASLKELVSDEFIPGGDQFFTTDSAAMCPADDVPLELPKRYAPLSLSRQGRLVFLEMESLKGEYWYPVRNE